MGEREGGREGVRNALRVGIAQRAFVVPPIEVSKLIFASLLSSYFRGIFLKGKIKGKRLVACF